jgi:hypothetical protein
MRGKRILDMSAGFFVDLLAEGRHPSYSVVEDSLPEDVHVLAVQVKFPELAGASVIRFLLDSVVWDEVPEGTPIPLLAPILQNSPGES